MASTPFADAGDVAARWRTLTSDEQALADILAEDASDIIRVRWPDIDSRIESGAIDAGTLTRIVANMVKRAMLNSDSGGLESRSQTAGPFAISDKFANPNGNLYLNAEDILALDGEGYTAQVRMGWLA